MTSQDQSIKSPPTTAAGTLSCLGPSMILSASIVGSGELIMTTTLGAEAGLCGAVGHHCQLSGQGLRAT